MKVNYKKYFKYIFLIVLLCGAFQANASIIDGTIDSTNHNAQVCENAPCTATSTSAINFGYFTDPLALPATSNVHVTDTELTGLIWGESFGWVVLNCANTVTPGGGPNSGSGCVSANGNFKVANDYNGILSGWAWGDNAGWVNFNSEANCDVDNNGFVDNNDTCDGDNTSTLYQDFNVTINSSGQFSGHAWAQNFGYIKFDCGSGVDYCVQTDWRPRNTRPQCSDGADNDNDGSIDNADSGCINSGVYDPTDDVELVSGGPDGGGDSICRVPTALNYGGPKPCVFPTTICLDTTATNYGGPLPCTYPPALCLDHTATNYGGPMPCVYPQLLCLDSNATNFGGSLPCTYPSNLCNDPIATNFGGPLPCTYPPALCLDSDANNYGGSAPCVYPQTCIGSNCNPRDDGGGGSNFCLLHPFDVKCLMSLSAKESINKASKIIAPIGALSGLALGLATSLFANPLTFSEIFLIPLRLWSLLLSALGLKRRNRPWGIVYDSVTKQPLDPAYVILQDLQGNEISSSITDLDGRYGFLVPPGQYKIIAHKTNYEFPSTKLQGRTSDEMYQDLYWGDIITITEGEVITKNIPLDPLKFDWNEFAKRDQKLMKFYSQRDLLITQFSNVLFTIGFIVTGIAVFVAPKMYNIITLAVYVLIFILKHTILKPRPYGRLVHKGTGVPLAFAIIRVYSVGIDHEIIKKVSDRNGKYYCLVPNGTYYVKIENKNPDGSYSLVYTSPSFEVKNGFIRKEFEI